MIFSYPRKEPAPAEVPPDVQTIVAVIWDLSRAAVNDNYSSSAHLTIKRIIVVDRFGAPFAGGELHHPDLAGPPPYAKSGGGFCFLGVLDLALGCARRFALGTDSGLGKSGLRPLSHSVSCQRTAYLLTRRAVIYDMQLHGRVTPHGNSVPRRIN
jgi:hypothetical protein